MPRARSLQYEFAKIARVSGHGPLLLRVWRAPGAAASEQGSIDGSPRPGARPTPAIGAALECMPGEQVSRARFHSLEKSQSLSVSRTAFWRLGLHCDPGGAPRQ